LKHLKRSQFALQLQPPQLVERLARVPARVVRRGLVHVAQQALARVLARARVVRQVRVRAAR
jgi:hypothetical protein